VPASDAPCLPKIDANRVNFHGPPLVHFSYIPSTPEAADRAISYAQTKPEGTFGCAKLRLGSGAASAFATPANSPLVTGGGANSNRLLIECDKNLLILAMLILVKTGPVGSRILFHFGRWKLEIQMARWAQDLAQKILVTIFVED
jgi:hypothetical protein